MQLCVQCFRRLHEAPLQDRSDRLRPDRAASPPDALPAEAGQEHFHRQSRTTQKRLSDDGKRLIIVERWLDQQVMPPRWRSKNRHVKLTPNEIVYYRQQAASTVTAEERLGVE